MGYIYKITNSINNKIYIGKTSYSVEERFKQHIKDSKKKRCEKRPLYNAMNKYGIDNFTVETIGEYPEEQLNEKEQYWIGYYHTYEDGYNATKEGDGACLYDHSAILKRIQEVKILKQVAEEFNCCTDIVSKIAKENNVELKQINGGLNFLEKKKEIYQFDKKTKNFIQSFKSVADAAKWCYENDKCASLNSGVRSHIAEAANGKRNSAYGYLWEYSEE